MVVLRTLRTIGLFGIVLALLVAMVSSGSVETQSAITIVNGTKMMPDKQGLLVPIDSDTFITTNALVDKYFSLNWNTDQCFSDCRTQYSVKNPINALGTLTLNASTFWYEFANKDNLLVRNARLVDSLAEFHLWESHFASVTRNVTNWTKQCTAEFLVNWTYDCSWTPQTIQTTKTELVDVNIDDSTITLLPGQSANITIIGRKNPYDNVDNIPVLITPDGLIAATKYSWWNGSWNNRICLDGLTNPNSTNESRDLELFHLNLTNMTGFTACSNNTGVKCTDGRMVINDTADNFREILFNVSNATRFRTVGASGGIAEEGSTTLNLYFMLNTTQRYNASQYNITPCFFYNNTGASISPNHVGGIVNELDSFETGINTAAGSTPFSSVSIGAFTTNQTRAIDGNRSAMPGPAAGARDSLRDASGTSNTYIVYIFGLGNWVRGVGIATNDEGSSIVGTCTNGREGRDSTCTEANSTNGTGWHTIKATNLERFGANNMFYVNGKAVNEDTGATLAPIHIGEEAVIGDANNLLDYFIGSSWNTNLYDYPSTYTINAATNASSGGGGVTGNFTISAFDNNTFAPILTFNATVNGSFFSTINGNISTNFSSGQVSVNVSAKYYFNQFISSWNASQNLTASLVKRFIAKAIDKTNLTNLTTWNVTIDTSVVMNVTGQGESITDFAANSTFLHNLTFRANQYFPEALTGVNVSVEKTALMFQAEITLAGQEKVSNASLSGVTFSVGNQSGTTLQLRVGPVNITGNKSGYYNRTQQFSFTPLENDSTSMVDFFTQLVNVTAQSLINTSFLNNFNSTMTSNSFAWTEFQTTTNGTAQFGVINGNYNITTRSTGYIASKTSHVVPGNLVAQLWRFQINTIARDGTNGNAINTFSATTMWNTTQANYTTTIGNITVQLNDVASVINYSAPGYATQVFNITGTAGNELNLTINFSRFITMNLYNESDGRYFFPNTTNGVVLRVFCPAATIQITITDNVTNTSFGCPWSKMRMYVTYGNTTYFRTLIPASGATTIDWYLINLNVNTAVQKTFYLHDLSNTFTDGQMNTEKVVGTSQVMINQDTWDVEAKIIEYFILYDSYILSLIDNNANTKGLGNYIADTQSIETITVPNVPFSPANSVADFQWRYLFDKPTISLPGSLFMQYASSAGTLNNVTWLIVNASNTAQVFINMSFYTTNGSLNYTGIVNGTQYLTQLVYNHSSYSTHTDQKIWNTLQQLFNDTLDGLRNQATWKQWFSVLLIILFVLIFSGLSTSAGAVTGAVLLGFFWGIGWLTMSAGLLAILEVIALIVALLGEGVR